MGDIDIQQRDEIRSWSPTGKAAYLGSPVETYICEGTLAPRRFHSGDTTLSIGWPHQCSDSGETDRLTCCSHTGGSQGVLERDSHANSNGSIAINEPPGLHLRTTGRLPSVTSLLDQWCNYL